MESINGANPFSTKHGPAEGYEGTIRVVLVDDSQMVRVGLRRMLELGSEIKVVGEASCAEEALQLVEDVSPDVVVMDIRMGQLNGIDATRLLKIGGFGGSILLLSMFDDYLEEAVAAGVAGYITKDTTRQELISAIRLVAEGGVIYGSALTRRYGEKRNERTLPEVFGREVHSTQS